MRATNSIRSMLTWAAVGLMFTINAMVTGQRIDDGGFVAAVSGLIAVVVLLIPLLSIIAADLRQGRMHMHELAVLAVFASCIQGSFTISAWIALFMLLSMVIETRTASGAHASLTALARLAPGRARRLGPNGEEEVEAQTLVPGDRIRIRPGENILADGRILKGTSSVNEANITGESLPVDKAPQAAVFAGTSNLSGVLEVEVEKVGPDTTLGKVRELILKAEATRLPFVRMIDEYVRYYTPVVLMLAAAVLFFNRGQTDGFQRVVALLVVACPIALILATPTAMVASLAAAARLGILVKDVNDIEALANTNAFVFDKTGTLTTGILQVDRLHPVDGVEGAELLRAAAVAEAGSNHPVARAVQTLAARVNLSVEPPDQVREEPGRGVRATSDGHEIVAGNLAWMTENGAEETAFGGWDDPDAGSMSLLFVMVNGRPLGWLGISDQPRHGAQAALQDLGRRGVGLLAMVSGDRRQVAERVADSLALSDWRGECAPAEKVEFVRELRADGYRVAFVGDGVNDAPALATSDIGIAMGAAGNDVALESATVALMNNELNRLPFLVRLAKTMRLTILQNFVVGGVLICGGITLSAMGRLSPVVAAVVQVIGALTVAMNSARLIRQGEELESSS